MFLAHSAVVARRERRLESGLRRALLGIRRGKDLIDGGETVEAEFLLLKLLLLLLLLLYEYVV